MGELLGLLPDKNCQLQYYPWPGALILFSQAGLEPIPAPTDYFSKPFKSWWFFPSATALSHTEYWAHEQLGILWSDVVKQVELSIGMQK
ncbi:MAG: hypothetical protein L3J57_08640 [Desulfuromusa sp.]|nr:hypothetical protein [Desulfuromusa sp.]